MSIIKVSDLTFCYEGSYDNIFENVSFQLDTDWRLGLTGRNGRGKTTLLRLLEGRDPYQGTIFPTPWRTHRCVPWSCWSASVPTWPRGGSCGS